MRILLVDDHPLIHEAFAMILAGQPDPADTLMAAGFDEACLQMAGTHPIDLVLLDLGLPGFTGIGALTAFRSRFPDTPVVVVSALQSPEVIHEALDAGAMGFIPKTFKPAAIRTALRFVAAGGVFVPEQVLDRVLMTSLADGGLPPPPPAHGPGSMPEQDDSVRERLGLTRRQFDVLKLLVCGMTNRRIADMLELSDNTVKAHVAAVLRTLDVTNRTEAVVLASRYGLRAVS